MRPYSCNDKAHKLGVRHMQRSRHSHGSERFKPDVNSVLNHSHKVRSSPLHNRLGNYGQYLSMTCGDRVL